MTQLIRASSGRVLYKGHDLCALSRAELKPFRRHLQIVFQDPFSSLNPRIAVGGAVTEPLKIHGAGTANDRRREAARLFELVHLDPRMASRYPHEFSGGQRQRISDRVAVMYLGDIVELALKRALYARPLHPYTHGLLNAVPSPDPKQRGVTLIQGDPPNPLRPPSGCPFRDRCPRAMPVCA